MTTNTRSRKKTDEEPADDGGEQLTVDEAGDAEALAEARRAHETALHRRRVQYGEYGQWVAAYDITAPNGTLAYAAGHPVPVAAVDEQTGAVVTERHSCHHVPDVRCDQFNQPVAWTEAGAVVRPVGYVEPAEGK